MSRISIKLSEDKTISDVLNSEYSDDNYIVVESDPSFSINEKYLWTVREVDGRLVHISTGLTPDEENQKSNTELTNLVIAQGTDIDQIKQSITALTNMQLSGASSKTSDKQEETK